MAAKPEDEVEVLFEYDSSRLPICCPLSGLKQAIETQLLKYYGVVGTVGCGGDVSVSEDNNLFMLQSFSYKWNAYVDVQHLDDISNGDKVTVVRKSSKPLKESSSDRVSAIIGKIAKPACALKKLFTPSTAKTFEPTGDCVVVEEKRKKKAAIKTKKIRPISVSIVMLKKFSPVIPKGVARQSLLSQGRIQTMRVTKDTPSASIREKISRAFNVSSYTVLECSTSHSLQKSSEQDIDGLYMTERRGCVYLCEIFEQSDGTNKKNKKKSRKISTEAQSDKHSSSSDFESTRKKVKELPSYEGSSKVQSFLDDSGHYDVLKHSKRCSSLSRKSTPKPVVISSSSSSSDGETVKKLTDHQEFREVEKQDNSFLEFLEKDHKEDNLQHYQEFRKIRKEQDKAFSESLEIDQLKEMRKKLKAKWRKGNLVMPNAQCRISLKLPGNSTKIFCALPSDASSKILYEIAFAYGTFIGPFSVFTVIPRAKVGIDSHVGELGSCAALIVEEDSSSPSPLEYLSSEEVPESSGAAGVDDNVMQQGSPKTSGVDDNVVQGSEKSGAGDSNVVQGLNMVTGKNLEVEFNEILAKADSLRASFMLDKLATHHGFSRSIRREHIYTDVLNTYKDNLEDILAEYPFRIAYKNERAVDTGGVCRDLYSSFWEEVYLNCFDGERLVIPAVRPGADIASFKLLGTILAHGFMVCGVLPIRIAFPVIASTLLGPDVELPDNMLFESFVDFLSPVECSLLRDAFSNRHSAFGNDMTSDLIALLSRFGSMELPTNTNLTRLVSGVAKHIFVEKIFATLFAMRSGVPLPYYSFWTQYSVIELYELYKSLMVTAKGVLKLVKEPDCMNAAQAKVYSYLQTFIRNIKSEDLRLFMRYVTGSSVMLAQELEVSFDATAGLSRAPRAHTCGCGIQLSVVYNSYLEFEKEFLTVLHNEYAWIMDAF